MRTHLKIAVGLSSLALAVIASPPLQAAQGTLTTTISRVMVVADSAYGGCMAALAISPKTKVAACGATWVTFNCEGATDPVRAYRMLDQAQLALVTGKKVTVVFSDPTINGYCVADRIDVIR